MATAAELRVPPLVAGDRLTRDEFLRRWAAHPEIKIAELLGGLVYHAQSRQAFSRTWRNR